MADLGKLVAKVIADGTGFKTGLAGAEKDAKSWSGRMSGILSFGMKALPGLGAGLGLAGAMRFLDQQIERVDMLADTAVNAGVDIETLTRTIGGLDKGDSAAAVAALERMQKVVAELGMGNKTLAADLASVGLDPEKMRLGGTEAALRAVAKAWTETLDPTEKSRIAFAVFGKSADKVQQVLEAIAKQSPGTAEALGTLITEEMLEKMTIAKTRLDQFRARKEGLEQQVGMYAVDVGLGKTEEQSRWASGLANVSEFFGIVPEGTAAALKDMEQQEAVAEKLRAQQQIADRAREREAKLATEQVNALSSTVADMAKRFNDGRTAVLSFAGEFGKFRDKVLQDGKDFAAASRTPLEGFQESLKKLDAMRAFGNFGLGAGADTTRDRILGQMLLDLPGADTLQGGAPTGTHMKDSPEAAQAQADFERRLSEAQSGGGVQKQIKDSLERLEKKAQEQINAQKEAVKAFEKHRQFVVK